MFFSSTTTYVFKSGAAINSYVGHCSIQQLKWCFFMFQICPEKTYSTTHCFEVEG